MNLRFTPAALAELDDAISFIASRSPSGARNVAARIRDIAASLTRQPRLGRRTSDGRLRRITATPYPYHVFYEATEAEVIVIAVRHAARDPATMPGET